MKVKKWKSDNCIFVFNTVAVIQMITRFFYFYLKYPGLRSGPRPGWIYAAHPIMITISIHIFIMWVIKWTCPQISKKLLEKVGLQLSVELLISTFLSSVIWYCLRQSYNLTHANHLYGMGVMSVLFVMLLSSFISDQVKK